ncbi:uncharacterized protein LOC124928784 [Impatiens glandulifera]|uniref:uncharacterized protein LOC124928784 n=1 Tax=Impatiens glandulifera TaxID=253017 RepID=UPI001FB0F0A3|nr:uncharacterized protein LOC124928784 [Impatiens glandulifera]
METMEIERTNTLKIPIVEEIIEKLKSNNLNEYEYLWRYAEELKSSNPGSTVEIMVTRGELLTAVGIDGNNQKYPIAWAVVESESTDSWIWFFDLLLKDIGFSDGFGLTIISDMQKGLVEAVGLVFPEAEHRLCARHWYNNWSTKCKGDALRNQFWNCANTTYPEKLDLNIPKLDTIMDGAAKRAISIPVQKWTKAFINATPKCDIIENNTCESFISSILSLSAMEESIITLLELIRVMIMKRIACARRFVKKWHQNISPNAKRLLELRKSECHEWHTVFNGGYGYEVSFGDSGFRNRQAIDIRDSCSCRLWNISGIPCTHVLCAIYYSHLNLEDYISHWYKKDTYVKAYQFGIQNLRGIESWVSDNQYKVLPPNVGRPPLGRPKIVRREVRE